ncbi:MAG: hypothetical protein ACRELY_12980 [Polyangiaceae bacterium]
MKKTTSRRFALASATLFVACSSFAVLSACTDDNAVHENVPQDSGTTSGDSAANQDGGTVVITGDSGIPYVCFSGDASTYEEIINACTPATKVDKHPTLPLLLPDGGLPPLP